MTTTDHAPRSARALDRFVRGSVLRPDDPGYEHAAQGWNLAVRQQPALVVRAASADDVRASVRFAGDTGLGVAVMATGHGVVTPCDGGLLIDTSALRGVRVDPRARRVRVSAGTRWHEASAALAPHGLAGLAGSSPHTGVVGHSLGGGFGWLGRRFGLASHHLCSAEVVTADGRLLRTTPEEEPELLWALGGGTGNFGIVTALEFRAHPVRTLLAGNLYYPLDRLEDVATFFADRAGLLPDTVTAALTVRVFPPTPSVPEPLRGRSVVSLRGALCGDLTQARGLVDHAVAHLGRPMLDTFTVMSPAGLPAVSADPVDPLAALSHAELLEDLDAHLVRDLLPLVGEGTSSPLVMLELRTLGGALRGRPDQLSPLARSTARFSLNAVGLAPDPETSGNLEDFFTRLSSVLEGRATGESYVNFLDSRMGRPHRVRAAYTDADWTRLVALKQRLDRDDMFRFNRNIA